jgi:hypothetical protein
MPARATGSHLSNTKVCFRINEAGNTRSARGVHPAAHPPRLSTAAAHPDPEPHGEEPSRIAARRRWSRCRARAEHKSARGGGVTSRRQCPGAASAVPRSKPESLYGASRILADLRRAQCAKAENCLLHGLCAQASHDHCESVTSSAAPGVRSFLDIGSQVQTHLAKEYRNERNAEQGCRMVSGWIPDGRTTVWTRSITRAVP